MSAPSNVWDADCQPSDDGPEGVRGARLLDRPFGTRLVSAVWQLDPGCDSGPYHVHHATEELLVVLEGEPTVRTPQGERQLRAGDVVHFPIGAAGAHQMLNRSEGVVRYLMAAAHAGLDIIEYVDEAKVIAYSHWPSLVETGTLFVTHELSDDR